MILPVRGATRDVGVMSGMQWHWHLNFHKLIVFRDNKASTLSK